MELCVNNGTVDLRTGLLSETLSDIHIVTDYRGLDYPTPDIDEFVSKLMLHNQDNVKYLQEYLGQCLYDGTFTALDNITQMMLTMEFYRILIKPVEENDDPYMSETLIDKQDQLLTWLVVGSVRYHKTI